MNRSKITLHESHVIHHEKGDLYRFIKSSDPGYFGFGELYFSTINYTQVKGWKMHTKMISNLVVPVGEVHFAFYDPELNVYTDYVISQTNYSRITVRPNVWMAFKGLSSESTNLVANFANIPHNPEESLSVPLGSFSFPW